MKEKLLKLSDLIVKSNKILITSHKDPDGDSIGSQLALAAFLEGRGKKCVIVNQGDLPRRYQFLDPTRRIQNINLIENPRDHNAETELVIVLDSTSLERIGQANVLIGPETGVINIDHHPDNDRFGAFNFIEDEASAVGEIIFNLLKQTKFTLTPQVSTQLYAAILTDTGRFKFSNTSPQCLKACAELIEAGADPRYITNQIYFNHSLPFLRLLASVLSHPQILLSGKLCIMTIKQDSLRQFGVVSSELEGVVDYTLFLNGVEIGLLLTEKEDGKTKVNLRSQNAFDVSVVARAFGGGGHRNAAGCTLDLGIDQTQTVILELIEKTLKNEPVRTIGS